MSNAKPLLLKLNIPFCAHKCSYCPLPVCSYDSKSLRAHSKAMMTELEAGVADASDCVVEAISIEGGSPCLTPPDLLRDLLRAIRRNYTLAEDVQIGLQTMPGDYSRAMVQRMVDEKVNFWTIGLETANAEEHALLDRPYHFDAITMVDTALQVFPMRSLNFELLYGIPGQTMHSWQHSLDAALAYEPEHLTLKPLFPLPGTPLFARCKTAELEPCSREKKMEFYSYAKERLESLGYQGYTIYDFALPGHENRYRLGELKGMEHIGFGFQADTCLDGVSYRNGHSLNEYLKHPTDLSVIATDVTRLKGTTGEALQLVISRLSLQEGLDETELKETFGELAQPILDETIPQLLEKGFAQRREDQKLYLTPEGIVSGALPRIS